MRPTGQIHFARLEKSLRLQRLLAYLQAQGEAGATTRDIHDQTGGCAVSAAITELRKQGITITCKMEGRTVSGSSVFRYRLVAQ